MKYVPSTIGVGQLSGKSGNNVASRNRFGSYIRTRVNGTNPNTALQQAARTSLSNFATLWRGLTDAQRAGWAALGVDIVRNNSLGQTYSLTGFQAYVGVNRNILTIGGAAITTAPSISNTPASLLSATVTATSV